ncbi:hypothetical protein [Solibaculum mannosilyticum]|uniref:hypothetical protein n=1 Tax=Solibaculum mannosilyticum TaxID=2780922 RepID=UPI0036F1B2B3
MPGNILAHLFLFLLLLATGIELFFKKPLKLRSEDPQKTGVWLFIAAAGLQTIVDVFSYLSIDDLEQGALILGIVLSVVGSIVNLFRVKNISAYLLLEIFCFLAGYLLYWIFATIAAVAIAILMVIFLAIFLIGYKLNE